MPGSARCSSALCLSLLFLFTIFSVSKSHSFKKFCLWILGVFFINKSQNYVCFLSHHASHSFIPNTRGPPFINFGPICHPHQILALGPLWTNLKHNEARLSKFSSLWVLGAFFLCFVISKSQNYVFVHNFLSHQASYSFIPSTRWSRLLISGRFVILSKFWLQAHFEPT